MNPYGTITYQNARCTKTLYQYARPLTSVGVSTTATPAIAAITRMGATPTTGTGGRARNSRLSATPPTTRLYAPTARWTELTSPLRSASVS